MRIDRNDLAEVEEWASRFRVTPLQLLACIEVFGTRVDDLERAMQRASTKMKLGIPQELDQPPTSEPAKE